MPTRCNRGFYCRSYCLLNMFRAPLCPSSGAQEYYTVVAACGISCCGFQVVGWCGAEGYVSGLQDAASCCLWYLVLWFSSCWSGVELRVMRPVCRMLLFAACGIWYCGSQVVGLVWSWRLFHTRPTIFKTTAPNTTGSNHLYNTHELLMMGIVVPETCWASNKICNKNLCCI